MVLLLAVALLGTPTRALAHVPRPVLSGPAVADPGVVTVGRNRVVVATGRHALRATLGHRAHHWKWAGRALRRLPHWARRGPIWAPDLARVGHRWVLYYAAPVGGLGPQGRCIGTAIGRTAYGPFHPLDRRPLVCQRGAHTRRAYDLAGRGRHRPRRGVIDPSYFRDGSGRSYLLYKTAGRPSSIRVLPLARGGLARRPHAHSRELVRSRGIVENPTVVRRAKRYYLFTSEGSWAGCGYRETWRASRSLWHWSAWSHPFLSQRSTRGICGPGGADVARGARHAEVYFHGWVRRHGTGPARSRRPAYRGARRAIYAARLGWHRGRPVLRGFLRR
ncbi:glycoside hydrolase family 43 protein [Nocardioides montaniterrae]